MSAPEDPVRLTASGSPEVRELLRSARLDEPSAEVLARLEARLGPTVASTPSATTFTGTKLWLVVAAVSVIGGVGVLWWTRDTAPRTPAPTVAQPTSVVPASPRPATVVPSAPALAPAAEPTPTPDVRRSPRRPTPPAIVASPPTVEPPAIVEPPPPEPAIVEPAEGAAPPAAKPQPREIDLLGPAHDALRSRDTQRALDLAGRHAELYPSGAMTEEREAIVIEGWFQLGRRDAAQANFERFVVRFPRSGYRARLQRLLDDGR